MFQGRGLVQQKYVLHNMYQIQEQNIVISRTLFRYLQITLHYFVKPNQLVMNYSPLYMTYINYRSHFQSSTIRNMLHINKQHYIIIIRIVQCKIIVPWLSIQQTVSQLSTTDVVTLLVNIQIKVCVYVCECVISWKIPLILCKVQLVQQISCIHLTSHAAKGSRAKRFRQCIAYTRRTSFIFKCDYSTIIKTQGHSTYYYTVTSYHEMNYNFCLCVSYKITPITSYTLIPIWIYIHICTFQNKNGPAQ